MSSGHRGKGGGKVHSASAAKGIQDKRRTTIVYVSAVYCGLMPNTPPAPVPPPPSLREAGELKLPSTLKLKGDAVGSVLS